MCKGVHVCAYMSMFVHECIHVCDAVYVWACVYVCACVSVCMLTYLHVLTYMNMHSHMCVCVCMNVQVCVCVMQLKSYPLLARRLHEDTCREASTGTSFTMLQTNLDCSAGPFCLFNSFILAAYFYFSNLKEVIPSLYNCFLISCLS